MIPIFHGYNINLKQTYENLFNNFCASFLMCLRSVSYTNNN